MFLTTLFMIPLSGANHVPILAPVPQPTITAQPVVIHIAAYVPLYDPQVGDGYRVRESSYRTGEDGYRLDRKHSPWYFGIQTGLTSTRKSSDSNVDLDFDDGFMLGALVGYRFTDHGHKALNWATELDLIWTDQDVDATGTGPINLDASSDMSVLGVLINGVVDYRFTPRFGAYGAAGLGMAWLDLQGVANDPFDFDDEDGPFLAWQLKGGLRFLFNESLSLRAGYRFLNIDDVELDDSINDARFDLETRQHILELGLLWGF